MINVRCNGAVIDNPVLRLWLRIFQRTSRIVFENHDIVYYSIGKDTYICMDVKSTLNSPEFFYWWISCRVFSLLQYDFHFPVYFYLYDLVARPYAFKH